MVHTPLPHVSQQDRPEVFKTLQNTSADKTISRHRPKHPQPEVNSDMSGKLKLDIGHILPKAVKFAPVPDTSTWENQYKEQVRRQPA